MTADTSSLHGNVAIVTSSGQENGISAGIALALARNGAPVAVNHVSDLSKDRATNVAQSVREASGQAIVVQSAVDTFEGARHLNLQRYSGRVKTDHIDIRGSAIAIVEKSGHPKLPCLRAGLIMIIKHTNNAGIAFFSQISEEPNVEQPAKVLQTNVLGPFHMVNAVILHMPPGGRIINTSSLYKLQERQCQHFDVCSVQCCAEQLDLDMG